MLRSSPILNPVFPKSSRSRDDSPGTGQPRGLAEVEYTGAVKKLLILTLVLVLVLATALATRPDRASFELRIARLSEPEGSGMMEQASSALRKIEAGFTLEYQDHNLWAIGLVSQRGEKIRYLGIFGTWIPLGAVERR